MMASRAFSRFDFRSGLLGILDRNFPSYLSAWGERTLRIDDEAGTHYGYVDRGPAYLMVGGLSLTLLPGMYFSVPGRFAILGGRGIVASRENHRAFFHIGGPAEHAGRLKYIDGCTDSLLIPPIKKGDPCLNLLYFPAGIDQTAHTHPSDRIGMVMSGHGRCHAWNDGVEVVTELEAGTIFCIHANGLHKFSTPFGDDMRVLAFHPDSDFGPTDQYHPMKSRTIIDGVSASDESLAELWTA